MQGTSNPKYLTQYAIREERLSDYSRRMFFHTEDGGGEMTLLQAYRGVHTWTIDYQMAVLNIQPLKSYHFLKLNYCLAGGCEVQLPQDRYVYVNEGRLSVDTNPPIGMMTLPSGKYVGLEIAIDLREITIQPPQAWSECGVDILAVAEQLSETQGSYLARATPELEQQARLLYEHVKADDLTLGDYRFLLLRFLWLLKTGWQKDLIFESAYLTRGQREIVMSVEERLTRDLRQRYVIEQLAAEAGVSPTSLKKYFAQTFGKPISTYLRELRVEKAKRLLEESALNIADIANEVGYENQGKFGDMFRSQVGVTPLEYRRIHRSNIMKKGREL